MKAGHWIILAILCAAILASWLFWAKGRTFRIELDESEIQAALERKFPYSKTYFSIFEMTYREPKATLSEGSDRLGLELKADLSWTPDKETQTFSGTCSVSCGVRYEREDRSFYLADTRIERIEIVGLSRVFSRKAHDVASACAREILEQLPVYGIKEATTRRKIALMALRKVEIVDGKMVLSLGF